MECSDYTDFTEDSGLDYTDYFKSPQGFVCGIFEKIYAIAQANEEKSVQSEQSVV